jgi:hypothetical protein
MNEDDSIGLVLYTRMNLRSAGLATGLIRLFLEHAEQFSPNSMEMDGRWRRIDNDSLEEAVAYWARSYNVLLQRQVDYESQLAVSMGGMASGGFNMVDFWIDASFFASREAISSYLQFCVALHDLLKPVYGNIHQTGDAIRMATVDHPKYGPTVMPVDLRKGLPDIYWANFFGPEYASSIGLDRLLTAPCHERRMLEDEGVLLVVTESPLAIRREQQHAVKNHIGLSHFHDRLNL